MCWFACMFLGIKARASCLQTCNPCYVHADVMYMQIIQCKSRLDEMISIT